MGVVCFPVHRRLRRHVRSHRYHSGGTMQSRREVATGFLQRLNDPGYRLHGENPSTATIDDAKRWSATYEKLIRFKRELLEICQKYAEESEPEVARAIRETDVALFE